MKNDKKIRIECLFSRWPTRLHARERPYHWNVNVNDSSNSKTTSIRTYFFVNLFISSGKYAENIIDIRKMCEKMSNHEPLESIFRLYFWSPFRIIHYDDHKCSLAILPYYFRFCVDFKFHLMSLFPLARHIHPWFVWFSVNYSHRWQNTQFFIGFNVFCVRLHGCSYVYVSERRQFHFSSLPLL